MYELVYLPAAKNDIVGIARYIKNELCNVNAAERITVEIVEASETLRAYPYMYPVHIPIRPLKYEYRKKPAGNFLIMYYVDEVEQTVVISRVIYARRNISSKIK